MRYPESDTFALRNILGIAPWAICYMNVVVGHTFLSYLGHYSNTYYIFALLTGCFLVLCSVLNLYFNKLSSVTWIDILLFAYAGVAICSNFIHRQMVPNETLENFLTCYLFFLIAKTTIKDRGKIMLCVVAFAVLFLFEYVFFLHQVFTLNSFSLGSSLLVSGTLENSGLFAGFAVALSVFLFCMARENLNNTRYWLLFMMIALLTISVVVLTRSRSAFFALAFVLLAFNFQRIKKHYRRIENKMLFSMVLILVCCLIFYFLLQLKMNSALGRQLIWKVSLQHVADQPFTGIGYGRFSELYNYWQAAYFRSGGAISLHETSVASLSFVAFNEYLQIFLETGLPGLVLFLLLNYRAVIFNLKNEEALKSAFPFQIALGVLLIFGLFSYPLHCTPMLFLYFTCLAVMSNLTVPVRVFKPHFLIVTGILFLSGMLTFKAFAKYQAVKEWNAISETSNSEHSLTTVKRWSVLNDELHIIPAFQLQYGSYLYDQGHYLSAKNVLQQNTARLPGISTLIILGKSYEALNEPARAEESYRLISEMVPNNFEAKYLLVNLYIKQKQWIKARALAAFILKMPVKIPSQAIDEILFEMKKICSGPENL